MDFMTIGEITRPQGIRGEVRVRPLTDDAARFKKLRVVYLDSKPYRIVGCRIDPECVFLTFDGVSDRSLAEELRGKAVRIDRINAVVLPDGTFFIADLLGCTVLDEKNDVIGRITDVDRFGAADVITAVTDAGKILRFPFLNKIVCGIDPEKKEFRVNKREFEGVCVYDD